MSDENDEYAGPEKRIEQRRKINDRRKMVRFEPSKTPRRSGEDRRGPKTVWDGRNES